MGFSQQQSLASPTGASLNLFRRDAEGAPVGVIQLCHGLAEHAARYGRFADTMAARGFHLYAHDHRGHGHTTAPDAPPRQFGRDGRRQVTADVMAVRELIERERPGLPVILFGHSMGGLIALNVLMDHHERFDAAAIWNANFTGGLAGRAAIAVLAWERFRLGSDVPSRLLPALTFRAWAKQVPDRRTDFDWLSRDKAQVDAYIADPLCGWDASVGMWRDLFAWVMAGADDGKLARIRRDMPINLVGGEKDPATSGGATVRHLENRMRRMGFSNLASRVYAGTRHESLNELNRDVIMQDFADWAAGAVSAGTR